MPTVHNIRLDSNFTITANSTPEDPNLSWAAKGLLWYILSRPKDWSIHTWQLASIFQGNSSRGNGKEAVMKMLKELRENGYIKYTKSKNNKGTWDHRYDVYPIPQKEFKKMFPEPVKPAMGEPALAEPVVLSSTELNKKGVNDDDDNAGASASLLPISAGEPDIVVTKTNGTTLTMCQSVVYRHFLKLPQFSTAVLQEAIRRIRKIESPINNILKYLESICATILEEGEALKKTKKPSKSYTPPQAEKIVVKKPLVNFGEYCKSMKEKEKKNASR